MPIGVPKVPFRMPGEPAAQWVDLYNRLYRDRVLFLCQELDDELANQLIGIMLYLNAEEESKGLFLYINSPGGSVTCGIAVYDAMHYVEADVTTICVGTAASMASFVLAGGDRGRRIALPHARIMIHQPEGGSQGQASDVVSESSEVLRIRHQVGRIYAERTGQPLSRISRDMDRDQFMSAREGKEYGLVDQVAVDEVPSMNGT
jgi:ATP-dependent Clp protease protease subunit|uniref:ATP-dependent Clp protease proteolytic subunit n=2 Tax=Elliptochloris antarctica TaxID=1844074 RepID=I3PX30_ELLAN|nr:clp protease proteolytic subunit [Hemichloris antarctica]AFI43877.1 clp protease proteolytic subunit [Hemichloris antarctica]AFI43880.1 clp protease proteolytic subunit [Hemichloris antarctica]